MRLFQIIGIVVILLGAISVYFSATIKKLFFREEKRDEQTFDMKENVIKVIGVIIAVIGVLMLMYL